MAEVSERAGGAGPPPPRARAHVAATRLRGGPGRGDLSLRGSEAGPGTLRPSRPEEREAPSAAAPGPPTPGLPHRGLQCACAGAAARAGGAEWSREGPVRDGGTPAVPRQSPPGPVGPPPAPLPGSGLGQLCGVRFWSRGHSAALALPGPRVGPSVAARSQARTVPGSAELPSLQTRAMLDPGTALRWGFLRAGGVSPSCPGGSKSLVGAASLS